MVRTDHVAIVNQSSLITDLDLQLVIQGYRNELHHVAATWSVPAPGLALYPDVKAAAQDNVGTLFIVDDDGDDDTYGAHTMLGHRVFGYVDAGDCRRKGEPIDRVFGHELFELMVNPGLDRWSGETLDGQEIAVEVSDAVQRLSYAVDAKWMGNGRPVEIANWVTPAWFHMGSAGPWDYMGALDSPQSLHHGGYRITRRKRLIQLDGLGAVAVRNHGRTLRILSGSG